jgi:hypothetical protein
VGDRPRHRREFARADVALSRQVDDSRNAAHDFKCRAGRGGRKLVRDATPRQCGSGFSAEAWLMGSAYKVARGRLGPPA